MVTKVFSILCYIVAGFFIYTVIILGFIKSEPMAMKVVILFGFSIPASIAYCVGLTLDRSLHRLRNTGIVILSSAGFSGFVIFTIACMFATDEFRKMMKPDMIEFFGDYWCGFSMLIALVIIGLVTLRLAAKKANQALMPRPVEGVSVQDPS